MSHLANLTLGKGTRPSPPQDGRVRCVWAYRVNSPFNVPAVKAAHSWTVKISTGPVGFLESRTATASGSIATSTQLPFAPLNELLRHSTLERSTLLIVAPPQPAWRPGLP